MYKYYKIAGLTVKMDTFGKTEVYALPYGIEPCEEADIIIETNYQFMKQFYPEAEDEICEYITTGREFYWKLADFDAMLLHSSAVVVDGKAYLFSADSGIGKSTHVALWRQLLGDEKVRILNDDKPAIRLEEDTWYAYGTPWSGKTGMNANLRAPLAGICFLERGETNKIELYEKEDIVYQIWKQTMRPKEMERRHKMLQLTESLLKKVPVWRLECNMEKEAAVLSYEAMSGIKSSGIKR